MTILPAFVAQSKLILVAGGLGDPHESTKPRRMRATEDVNINAEFEFLCGGVRRWMGERAERKQEGESAKCARVELVFIHFL